MKRILVAIFLLTLLLAGLAVFAAVNFYSPTSKLPSRFIVSNGESASSVVNRLYSAGHIRSVLFARLYLKLSRLESSIKPGAYTLPSGNLSQTFTLLASGPQEIWVTFPEGWRREQFANRLAETLDQIDQNFSRTDFITQTATLEGQLFPDTYLVPSNSSTKQIVSQLLNNFRKKTNLSPTASYRINMGTDEVTLTGQQVLTLASLLERETKSTTDRQIVAGIILKRLNSSWPLQIDATIQYAQDSKSPRVLNVDYDFWSQPIDTSFVSPFNTYLHQGLPPHPIANPGLTSINAILKPEASPYWYYLSDDSGKIYYSATYAQHLQYVDKYLRH